MSHSPLLSCLFDEPDATLLEAVEKLTAGGQDPNTRSEYGETPLMQAFRRGRMDVFTRLVTAGADLAIMRWTPLHEAVAMGSLEEVHDAAQGADMSARDVLRLTPFLLACDIGDSRKAAELLPLSSREDLFSTHERQGALTLAAVKKRSGLVEWLLANGFDVDEPDEFGGTALIWAAQADSPEVVKFLLDAGADVAARFNLTASVAHIETAPTDIKSLLEDMELPEGLSMEDLFPDGKVPEDLLSNLKDSFQTAASETVGAGVARLLIEAGAEPGEFENEVLRELTGAALIPEQQITPEIFKAQKHRRFGTSNPEPVAYEFWLEMVRTGVSAYQAHQAFGKGGRDMQMDAVWCHNRFGMSTTALPDGTWIQIAGEHEDHYDPDFCIYNDVFAQNGGGKTQIYLYPEDVFPPTDFHTATLVDDAIIIIGNLGYMEHRQPGFTPVFRLNLADFSIEKVETSGEMPGWISSHQARLEGDNIIVWGGETGDVTGPVAMDHAYQLQLPTGIWQKLV